jgi:hypothetical protein
MSNTTVDQSTYILPEIRVVWAIYSAVDMAGLSLCLILIYSAKKSPVKTSMDVIAAGICAACACLSATCGTRNFVSAVIGSYAGGPVMCKAESFLVVIGMMSHFQIVCLTGIRTVTTVVFEKSIPASKATMIVIGVYLVAVVGSLVFESSPAERFGLGTYCFFDFESIIVKAWVAPMFFITIAALCASHAWVTLHASRARNAVRIVGSENHVSAYTSDTMTMVIQRSIQFVALLAVSWMWVIVALLAQASGHPLSNLTLAVLGASMPMCNVLVPIAYGLLGPYQRRTLISLVKCRLCKRTPGGRCVWIAGRSQVDPADTIVGSTALESPRSIGGRSLRKSSAGGGSQRTSPATFPPYISTNLPLTRGAPMVASPPLSPPLLSPLSSQRSSLRPPAPTLVTSALN